MPGALKDKLPNRALSGPELALISEMELRGLLEKDPAFAPNIWYRAAAFSLEVDFALGFPHGLRRLNSRTITMKEPRVVLTGAALQAFAVEEFRQMVSRDYGFHGSVAYKRVQLTLTATFHVVPSEVEEAGVVTGGTPLPEILRSGAVVISLQRKVVLENPNIDRINHGMPIVVQRATPPPVMMPENQLPGEPPTAVLGAPQIENMEFRYDATQFPAPTPPVDSDMSAVAAARLGVPQKG